MPDEGAVDEFLTNVKTSEKQADGMGIAFKGFDWNNLSDETRLELAIQAVEFKALKEAGNYSEVIPDIEIESMDSFDEDTTTKAKKKMPKVEVEIEEEDDMEDDEDMDMEDDEISMKADSEYMTKMLSPMATELKAHMDGVKTELKNWFQDMLKKKGDKDEGEIKKAASDLSTVLEVADAHTERITLLEQRVKELGDTLTKANEALNATTKELSALTGNQPPINRGIVESQKDFLGQPALYLSNGNGRPTQSNTNVVATNAPASEEAYKQLNTPFLQTFIGEIATDGSNGRK